MLATLMRIELKKGKDGRDSLACVRDDGSRTWAKLHPFFPMHDLTHCAVESVLGFRNAFFGLVASGWEIDDFAARGAAQRMPAEALWAEHIVGMFDLERASGQVLSARDMNALLPAGCHQLTDIELAAIKRLRGRLAQQWTSMAPGETMAVSFPVDSTPKA